MCFTTKRATFQSSIHVFNAPLERQIAVIVRELREAAGRVVGRLALGFAAVTILIYTPYITRKGVRIWASQYGLKVFCLRIPREKYRG